MTSEQETAMYDQPSGVSREELIKKAAEAKYPYSSRYASEDGYSRTNVINRYEGFKEGYEAALAVFEEAHTPGKCQKPGTTDIPSAQMSTSGQIPTGDEREALGWREACLYSEGDIEAQDDFMAGWRTADRTHCTVQGGFTRSAVKALTGATDVELDDLGGFSDDEREALAAVIRSADGDAPNPWSLGVADRILAVGFHRTSAPTSEDARAIVEDAMEAYLEAYPGDDHRKRFAALDRLAAGFHRTVQAEPSDAAVLAALEAYSTYREADGPGDAMRAALRAAAAVQGGERV